MWPLPSNPTIAEMQALLDDFYDYYIVKKNPPGFDVEKRSCQYRAPNGAKCAIGRHIPDDLYIETIEGDFAAQALSRVGNPVESSFYADLQVLHDNLRPSDYSLLSDWCNFDKQLGNIIARYKLQLPKGYDKSLHVDHKEAQP